MLRNSLLCELGQLTVLGKQRKDWKAMKGAHLYPVHVAERGVLGVVDQECLVVVHKSVFWGK